MRMMTVFLVAVFIGVSSAVADEVEELKVEVQELKEKITHLNNRLSLIAGDGIGLSVGLPAGVYDGEHVYGAEVGYFLKNRLGFRMDFHFLGEYRQENYLLVALPAFGILGKSEVFYNLCYYGGFFFGISQELTQKKQGPFFLARGFGGIEFFSSSKFGFFVEIGGGGILSDTSAEYARGALITGGTRIYF